MNEFIFEELKIGFEKTAAYIFTTAIYESFIQSFRDVNPLHVDKAYANLHSFPNVVMHGGILQGFLSHFIGMVLPGKRAILLSCEIRYAKPNFLNDEIAITGRVSERVEEHGIVMLDVQFKNLTQAYTCARARVQVGTLK